MDVAPEDEFRSVAAERRSTARGTAGGSIARNDATRSRAGACECARGQKGGATRDFRAFFHEHCPSFPASSVHRIGKRGDDTSLQVVAHFPDEHYK
jgi:hypothetical protein